MPVTDTPGLSDEQKQALLEAHRNLSTRVNPCLQKMFESDGFPHSLYHYTDFAGLKGILQTHSLWATYTRTLNDGSEQKYGAEALVDYLKVHFHEGLAKYQFDEAMKTNSSRSFATCFSESGELLSMWRSYAGRGGGYCLEFDGLKMLACSFPPFPKSLPFKIAYGELPEAVQYLMNAIGEFACAGNIQSVVSASWVKLMSVKIKHPAFVEEKEWRIVIPDPPLSETKFRSGQADIKPYVELCPAAVDSSKGLPLKRILLGPTLRQDDVLVEAINLMLQSYGYQNISIEPCGIPYRL
jgi:hypothetical protein